MATAYDPGQAAVNVTAAPNIQTEQARYDPNGSVNSLLAALGTQGTQQGIDNFRQVSKERTQQEQQMKLAGYVQEFTDNNKAGGPVSQAQVRALHPELVPVIAATISETLGKQQGARDTAAAIAELEGNDALRLNTADRNAYIAKFKADAFSKIPAGNEFYAAGIAQGTNSAFAQNEQQWAAQTATYQTGVMKIGYGQEIVNALHTADPQAAMMQSDSNWAQKSNLNNLERNAVAVDAVIKYARQTNNPDVLDQIPQRFLNVDSKAAIYQERIGIQNYQYAQVIKKHEIMVMQRADATRATNIDTLTDISKGIMPDASNAKYLSNPEAQEFLTKQLSTPTLPAANSIRVASAFEASITSSGMIGRLPPLADIQQAVQKMPGLNPGDRAALMAKVPDLVKGSVLMNSESVRQEYRDHVQSNLDVLSKSTNQSMITMLQGTNLMSTASQMFEGEIQRGYKAFYDGNKQTWPDGAAQRDINRQASEVTNAWVQKNTSITALQNYHPEVPAPSAATARPSTAPTAVPSAAKQPSTKQQPIDPRIAAELKKRTQ